MSDDPIKCPAEKCNYVGPPSSVLAHYSGSQDDRHAGGYHMARERVMHSSGPDPDADADDDMGDEQDPDADADADADAGADADKNPMFDARGSTDPADPDGDDDDTETDTDGPELPCGHESLPHEPERVKIVTCEECGGKWRVRP